MLAHYAVRHFLYEAAREAHEIRIDYCSHTPSRWFVAGSGTPALFPLRSGAGSWTRPFGMRFRKNDVRRVVVRSSPVG